MYPPLYTFCKADFLISLFVVLEMIVKYCRKKEIMNYIKIYFALKPPPDKFSFTSFLL